jgi:hypothetical protein
MRIRNTNDKNVKIGSCYIRIHVSESLAFLDLPLNKDGESLVEPEMLKALVGHEVPGPGVRNLVGDHVSVRL